MYIEGYDVRVLAVDDVAVAATLIGGTKSYTVCLLVWNQSKNDLHVLPESFTLRGSEGKAFDYLNPDKIASQIERDARRSALGLLFASILARRNTTSETSTFGRVFGSIGSVPVSGSYTEQSRTTTASRDPAMMAMAARTGEAGIANAEEYAQSVRATALRANTVMPGEHLVGLVYFKRGKAKGQVLLRIPLGAQTLEFPLTVQ
jgi:hypothetical protein